MVELKDITKKYQEEVVLNSISLKIQPGEIIVIVGESGSGKTTLLNVISGNLTPDSGTLRINEQEIELYFTRLNREFPEIKLVPQDFRLKPNYSVSENINLALTTYSDDYRLKRIEELLHLCGITEIRDKKTREISGGEKQRTAIARAIADEPVVLLLDEPFSNLDSINRTHLRNKIVEIVKFEAMACILVTHDLLDAFLIADRIGIMQQGNLLTIDSPKNIFSQTKNPYIKKFVDSAMQPLETFLKTYADLF